MANINTQTEHMDKEIRAAIVARLNAIPLLTVYKARVKAAGIPIEKVKAQRAASVYTLEDFAEKDQSESNLTRSSKVYLALYIVGPDASNLKAGEISIDDQMDDLRFVIEKELIGQYETLGKLIYRLNYQSMRIDEIPTDNGEFLLTCTMEFVAIYHQYIKRTP